MQPISRGMIWRKAAFVPSMVAPLVESLAIERGITALTFTRATVAFQTDFEKQMAVVSGEPRFKQARRVKNIFTSDDPATFGLSGVVSTSGFTDPLGGATATRLVCTGASWNITQNLTLLAGKHRDSWWIKSNTGVAQQVRFIIAGGLGDSGDVTVTTSWQRLSDTKTVAAGTQNQGLYGDSAGNGADILVWHPMLENVQGQANQAPSEWVSATESSVGITGVKQFHNLNASSVASNVVTTGMGAAISGTNGMQVEAAATQLCLDPRDMTTANWTLGATMTRARTSVGADGAINTATRLTGGAVAATNTILQTLTAAATSRTNSCYVKRITGTGTVTLMQGTATLDITALINSSTYSLVQLNDNELNVAFGLKISTNGDAIDVDFNQFEAGSVATSPITTTRNADILTSPTAGILAASGSSLYVDWTYQPNTNARNQLFESYTDANNYIMLYWGSNTLTFEKMVGGVSYQATIALVPVIGTTYKIGASYGSQGVNVYLNGVKGTPNANATNAVLASTIYLGTNGSQVWPAGFVKNIRMWPRQLTDNYMKTITT